MQFLIKALLALGIVFLILGLTIEHGWYVFGPFLTIVILLLAYYAVRGIRQLRSGDGTA